MEINYSQPEQREKSAVANRNSLEDH